MPASTHNASRANAARIARLLRPGAHAAGGWVSCEAVVRTAAGALLDPAVVVVSGEPPYDGIVEDGVLLVVETDADLAARWDATAAGTVWAPSADGAVIVHGGISRRVAADGQLTVAGHPLLVIPAAALLRHLALVSGSAR